MRKTIGVIAVWIAILAATGGVAAAQVRGRVVLSGAERSNILVSLVTHSGQIVHQAFTGARGTFQLEGVSAASLRSDNPMYIVINEQGYKPYRQQLYQSDLRSGGVTFTIYLEPDDPPVTAETDGQGAFIVDARQLQARMPPEAREEYRKGLEESEDGNHERAVARFEHAVELAPDYYDAWIDLGGQYDALGRRADARAAYERAAQADPNGALAYVNLGALSYQEGERHAADGNANESLRAYAAARDSQQTAVGLDPRSVPARFYLGAALYRLGRYVEAELQLKTAIDLAGRHAQARLMLINVYTRLRRYDAALEQTNAFLIENPDAPQREAIERVRSQLNAALRR